MTIKKTNKKLSFICATLAILATFTMPDLFGALESTWHFDTDMLKKPEEVREKLISEENFQAIDIDPAIEIREKLPNGQLERMLLSVQEMERIPEEMRKKTSDYTDNIKLKGLFLDRGQDAKATIICTPGFHPGLKEGFAPFVKIAPQDCNLLFLELRNHGESTSKSFCQNMASFLTPSFMSSLLSCPNLPCCGSSSSPQGLLNFILGAKDYGKHEHKDIIGAIMNISKKTHGKPIILFGWCSGAFFAARTLIKLQQLKQPTGIDFFRKYNIQGLIFDSGFVSLNEIMKSGPTKYINKKMIPKDAPKEKKSFWNNIKSFALSGVAKILKFLVGGQVKKYDKKTRIDDKMNLLEGLPVLFVHSKEDYLAPLEDIQKLQSTAPNSELWETEGECHATNQLKHKDEYKERMGNWLQATIQERVAPANNPGEQNQAFVNIIRIIDEIIGHIDNPQANSQQEGARLQQELEAELNNPANNVPPQALIPLGELERKARTNSTPVTLEDLKNALLEVKRILIAARTQQNPGENTQNRTTTNPRENQQTNPAFTNIIRIIDEIIGHIDNPQTNSEQEKTRLEQELVTELMKPTNNIPPQALTPLQALAAQEQATPGSVTDQDKKNALLEVKRILTAAQTNIQSNNTQKQAMNLQAIIKLIDKIIEHLEQPSQNSEQELNRLVTKLGKALHDSANKIPKEATKAFDDFMKKTNDNPDQFTPQDWIIMLEELKGLLGDPNKGKNKKPKGKPVNGKKKKPLYHYSPLAKVAPSNGGLNYYSPGKKDNKKKTPSGGSSGSGSSSDSYPYSNYDNDYYPSNYGSYGNDYDQYPSQPSNSGGRSNYSGESNGYDKAPWSGRDYSGSNNRKKESNGEENHPVTKYDFIFEDESYEDDPDMEDQPDETSYFSELKNYKRRKKSQKAGSQKRAKHFFSVNTG